MNVLVSVPVFSLGMVQVLETTITVSYKLKYKPQ